MSEALRILLVDDEAPARQRMRHLLGDIAAERPTTLVGEAHDGIEALEMIGDGFDLDVALIDIRMPRMDGIELARHLIMLPQPPAVIFVTAFDEYAVKAFEVSAIDYLLKPVKAARLVAALNKAQRINPAATALRELAPHRRHLRSVTRGKVLLIPVADVLYFKAELKYVTARTAEREYVLVDALAQLEEEFGARFLRIHRNCIVARDAIVSASRATAPFDPDGELRWALTLRDVPELLYVSRRQWPHVKEALDAG